MGKVRSFLQKKDIVFSGKRYGIDALGAMAQGLFCTLLVGTILDTLGTQLGISFLTKALFTVGDTGYTVGKFASAMVGPGMAVAIGYALHAPMLVLFSLIPVGYATNLMGGAGGPLAVYFVVIVASECGKLVSKETRIDLLVTPIVTILVGVGFASLVAAPIGAAASSVGKAIMWATEQEPFLMGMLVSVIIGVNTLFAAMLRSPAFTPHALKNLKFTCGGGAQVQRVVAEDWLARTGVPILEAYGLTECSPAVCGNIPGAPWDGSVGVPVSSTEVSIRGDGFRDLGVCPEGADPAEYTGEICVRGPQVMRGYWKKPEETAAVMRDGWLRTGDVGHMDAKGVISITDRKKDMILVSGFNVYPNEVENVIASMPGVLEVGVVGVSSPKSGESVKAVIVKKDPALTADDVKNYCRSQLTRYKVPHQIVFVDALPKTAVGKILRRELKDL